MTKVRVKRFEGGAYKVWINDFEVPDVFGVKLQKDESFTSGCIQLMIIADFETEGFSKRVVSPQEHKDTAKELHAQEWSLDK